MRVIYADAETAGVVQSEITRAGLDGELEVRFHPWVRSGLLVIDDQLHDLKLITNCYAGLRAVLAGG
jgi:hypothetical protein